MATYYIAPNGDDTNDGSEGSPWLNLAYAVENSEADATIIVKQGVTLSTSPQSGFTIGLGSRKIIGESENPADNVLDGNGTAIFEDALVDTDCEIRNITFRNSLTVKNRAGFFTTIRGLVDRCIFENIVTAGDPNDVQARSGLFGTTSAGILRNSIVYNLCCVVGRATTVLPIRPALSVGITTVDNCIFYNDGNPPAGATNPTSMVFNRQIGGEGTTTGIVFKNTIFLTSPNLFPRGLYDLLEAESVNSTATFINCCYHNLTADESKKGLTLTDTIDADPLFVDEANGNFRLRPTSPCIGTGSL